MRPRTFLGIIALFLVVLVVTATLIIVWLTDNKDQRLTAVIAAITLVVTVAILGVYAVQALIMERQENLQRAWLIAGMGFVHFNEVDANGIQVNGPNGRPIVFCNPGFHNYGQTPAFVRYLQWGFCSDPPPAKPNWSTCTKSPINDWIDTSGKMRPALVQPRHELMATGTIIFYGRLVYSDVLKRERHSGFIYRWHGDGGHERLGDKYPKYVEWT